MASINKPINSAFIFPKGTSDKMNKCKPNKETYTEIKRQADLLRKNINKNK